MVTGRGGALLPQINMRGPHSSCFLIRLAFQVFEQHRSTILGPSNKASMYRGEVLDCQRMEIMNSILEGMVAFW